MRFPRSGGILLHVSSLPGGHGIGDLGPAATCFLDFLRKAGQRWWQVLPLNPPGYGDSPYQCTSSFAGNPLMISLERMVETGHLHRSDLQGVQSIPTERVRFNEVRELKDRSLRTAFARFVPDASYLSFIESEKGWLDDYALFTALSGHYRGASWTSWDEGLRRRTPSAMMHAVRELGGEIEYRRFVQYLFFRQHERLLAEARERGVGLIGDLPIFVAHNSADVWANQHLFELDDRGEPTVVAGVPPDYFSKTGQRWGNPLYRWDVMDQDGYGWWLDRLRSVLRLYDAVRIDHFRGFEAYWEIRAGDATAVNGRWVKGPGARFFDVVRKRLGDPPILAEDLGLITPEVEALRDTFDLPGMKVLQFAFSDAANVHLPHNYRTPNCVVYTGTHDNDTTVGWWNGLAVEEKENVRRYLGRQTLGKRSKKEVADELIRTAFASTAGIAIIPAQDLLGLGSEARMNAPGKTAETNWSWRVKEGMLDGGISERLAELTRVYGRVGDSR